MNTAPDQLSAPVMIAAGGTGGHVIPALEVARVLRERGVPVVWMGTRRGLEAKLVPAANIAIDWLNIGGLRGKGVFSLVLAPFKLLRACWQALSIMRRRRPRAVLGMGGFVAGPTGVAAKLSRRPLVLHEQNAIAGMTNKMLRPVAKRVLQAMDDTFPPPAETVGNPVREEMSRHGTPSQRFSERNGPMRILVVGGSQGAKALNEVVPKAIHLLKCKVDVRHQAGADNRADTEGNYAGVGIGADASRVVVHDFIDDMAASWAWADVAICRSGAMTVAELAAVGVASILVPFPYAVDDHQTANAQPLLHAGAAIVRQQSRFEPVWLAQQLTEFATRRSRLLQMAKNAHELACPESATRVADAIMEVAQ